MDTRMDGARMAWGDSMLMNANRESLQDERRTELGKGDEKKQMYDRPKQNKVNKVVPTAMFGLKVYMKRVIDATTFHGIGNIVRAEIFLMRAIYTILTLASYGYCIYQIAVTVEAYFEYPISTASQTGYESPSEFPVVSICMLNPFNEVKAAATIDGIISTNPNLTTSNYNTSAEYLTEVNEYFRYYLLGSYLNDVNQMGKDLGFGLDQMLISCRFQSDMCSESDFMYFYDYYFMNCYRFNQGVDSSGASQSIKNSGIAGWRYGLQLELYAGSSAYQEKYVAERGFRVLIFNKSDPLQIHEDIGINAPVGFETNIAVRRSFTYRMSAPYGNCLSKNINEIDWNQNDVLKFMYSDFVKGNTYYYNGDFNWTWTISYSQPICLKMCYQMFLYAACSCYDFSLPRSPELLNKYISQACVNSTQYTCIESAESVFYSSSDVWGGCFDNCPEECNEIKYDYDISMALFPTVYYYQLLNDNPSFNSKINLDLGAGETVNYSDYTDMTRAIAKVNIFYEDMSYAIIQESPQITFDILLANIGGSMGLFMGASLLSLAEFLDVFYYCLLCLYRVSRTRGKRESMKLMITSTINSFRGPPRNPPPKVDTKTNDVPAESPAPAYEKTLDSMVQSNA